MAENKRLTGVELSEALRRNVKEWRIRKGYLKK